MIGLTVWQKYWGRAKAWPAISYILLISTFSLQPTAFWNWCSKHAFIFKILFHFQNVLSFSKFLKGYSCFKAFKQTFEVNFVSFMKFNIDNNRANFIHSTCLMRSWYCSSVYHLSINIFKKWIFCPFLKRSWHRVEKCQVWFGHLLFTVKLVHHLDTI